MLAGRSLLQQPERVMQQLVVAAPRKSQLISVPGRGASSIALLHYASWSFEETAALLGPARREL